MTKAVLISGGNIGNIEQTLLEANDNISKRIGTIIKKSNVYTSKAWGFESEDMFLNQVLVVETNLMPLELLDTILDIETCLGRKRSGEIKKKGKTVNYCSRNIDIDILFYDDLIIDSERLVVPHPLLHEREFVLRPLSEIMGDMIHPVLKVTINDLFRILKER